MPVYVPAPMEYARTNTANMPSAPIVLSPVPNPCRTSCATFGTLCRCAPMPPTINTACVRRNAPKIGASTVTDSFTPRRFMRMSTTITAASVGSFQRAASGEEHAEHLVRAAGDRDRDRQDVVNEQGRSGDHTPLRPQQLAGHDVAAAAKRELANDLGVGERDDEHRDRAGEGECQRQVGVLAQRAEGFIRPIGRRGQSVGAQANPCQKRDQRDRVERVRVLNVAGLAEDQA